jgi:hypothetical protein
MVYSLTKDCAFGSLKYVLLLEYSKRHPLNRRLALVCMDSAILFFVIILSIVASNTHIYPASVAQIILIAIVTGYSGYCGFNNTTFLGPQHVRDVPDIVLPVRFWNVSEEVLENLVEYGALSDEGLRRFVQETRQEANEMERATYWDWAHLKLKGFMCGVKKGNQFFKALPKQYALELSLEDFIKIKRHLWRDSTSDDGVQSPLGCAVGVCSNTPSVLVIVMILAPYSRLLRRSVALRVYGKRSWVRSS